MRNADSHKVILRVGLLLVLVVQNYRQLGLSQQNRSGRWHRRVVVLHGLLEEGEERRVTSASKQVFKRRNEEMKLAR